MTKKESDEFIKCIVCNRLTPSNQITFIRIRFGHGKTQAGRYPVCRLCKADPKKARFYIAQQRKKK